MANLYSPESVGIKPPTGGFQQGGWYSGRQYWGGQLSDPGAINPLSNQVGAGQDVSKEVVDQSDPLKGQAQGTDWDYIQRQKQQQAQNGVAPTPQVGGGVFNQASSTGTGGGAGIGLPTQSEFNLPELYKSLTESSKIKESQDQLTEMEKGFVEAKGKINDNPYLSEATRVGRIAKIESLHAERSAGIRDQIAMEQADVETQLNLQTKQFDIDSQQSKDALDQLNFLLSSGALSNASGEDIATLTRTTGISGSMIQGAINQSKQADMDTQLITSTGDNGVVTSTLINKQTGEVISQSSLGAVGKATKSSGGDTKIDPQEVKTALIDDVRKGEGIASVYRTYSGLGLDPNEMLYLYNSNSPHGVARETDEELRALGIDTDKR